MDWHFLSTLIKPRYYSGWLVWEKCQNQRKRKFGAQKQDFKKSMSLKPLHFRCDVCLTWKSNRKWTHASIHCDSEQHGDTGPADRGTHLFISGVLDNLTWTLPSNIHSKILPQKGWSVYKSDACPTITQNGHEPPALMTFRNDCMRHRYTFKSARVHTSHTPTCHTPTHPHTHYTTHSCDCLSPSHHWSEAF